MKELNREDCERIYGCGINIAPALRGLGEFGEDFAHGAEGGIQLADALGLFEPPEKSTPKYTSDPQLLNMDVNIANTYMHEIQTHTGSDQITDTMREDAIHNLQNDGRVYFNPISNHFESLGGTPGEGTFSADEIKDPDVKQFIEQVMNKDVQNVHSSDASVAHNALEFIQNSTREGAYHFSVEQNKFVVG
ncbi:TPA: hypothetical protein P7Q51_003186 [Escherichia coli]|nr:hypothetical protein [Escherichia coli]HDP9384215.1 hypothetical protein [Escherichia coli]HDQ0206205.1 hypothetical protein [Escherichia coli]HDQ0260003.1 hypothetical protein [Escherichia coli]HDQ1562063.1 hypothetical protein [Escherichia coli]